MYCQYCGNPLAAGARFCNSCGMPVPAGGATNAAANKNSGVAAIVIAVVVLFGIIAFIGILAAIAIPNMLTAKQRAMQRRTIATMRSAATSVEEGRQSLGALPAAITAPKDAWNHPLAYKSDGTSYWIVSAGKDGVFEEDDFSRYTAGATTNFDADIVLKDGELLRAPEGVGGRRGD
jgi:type II secretory pathway pseudopilin PulG